MIEVNGQPFIGHLLRAVAAQGIREVVLLVGYLGDAIVEYVGDGAAFGVKAAYVWDGEKPIGTAGAIRRALPVLGDRFLVTFGDAFLNVDYAAVMAAFEASGASGLMTVYQWSGQGTTRPNAAISNGRVTRYDKETTAPDVQYVDYGLSAFRARAFEGLADGESADLGSINRELIAANDMAAFIVGNVPFEIGSPEGFAATQSFFRRQS